jgi:hypothetical protein
MKWTSPKLLVTGTYRRSRSRLKAVTADIQTFARSQVEKLQTGEHGKTLYLTNDGLKEKIVQTLAKKAEGM